MNIVKSILVCAVLAAVAGCKYVPEDGTESVAPFSRGGKVLPGTKYMGVPRNAKLFCESGGLALVSGETAADVAYNKTQRNAEPGCFRNSLFARLRGANGKAEWRLLLTTGAGLRIATAGDEWCAAQGQMLKECLEVLSASFSPDGRHLWLVCNPHTFTYTVVCSYDMASGMLCPVTDGDTADVQPDGTIRVKNKKTYLQDEKGNPLGAAWYDEWITPDGRVVRKTKPRQ